MTKLEWPMIRSADNMLSLDEIRDALNNLNERLSALESKPAANVGTDETGFTAADRAMLQEVGQFFGVHAVVANTVASQNAGVTDIDPNTGMRRPEVAQRQTFLSTEQPLNGA